MSVPRAPRPLGVVFEARGAHGSSNKAHRRSSTGVIPGPAPLGPTWDRLAGPPRGSDQAPREGSAERERHMSITVYSKPACVQCDATYRALDRKGVEYSVVDITQDAEALEMV